MRKRTIVAAVALVALAACGGGGGDAGSDGHAHEHEHEHPAPEAGFAFGAPGDPEEATQAIEVATEDPYRFDPGELEVRPGETVTFVVTNEGEQEHEFVLGDAAYQDSHGEDMAAGEMHHEGNAVSVGPGDTQELTWTFPEEGEVLYGCHVQGHYQAGMVGSIRITS